MYYFETNLEFKLELSKFKKKLKLNYHNNNIVYISQKE